MTSPISNSSPLIPDLDIKPTPLTQNGFTIASDQKSASKEFVFNGRNLTITVYFPENTTPEQRSTRLSAFTKENLDHLGAYAIALGLGKDSKKGKGKINAIAFKQDQTGSLSEAIKHFSNGSPAISISLKHYQDKIDAISDPKSPKRAKFLAKRNTFQRVQAFWQKLQSPSSDSSTPTPKPGQNTPDTNSPLNSDEEEFEHEEEEADRPLTPPDPNNNANSV